MKRTYSPLLFVSPRPPNYDCTAKPGGLRGAAPRDEKGTGGGHSFVPAIVRAHSLEAGVALVRPDEKVLLHLRQRGLFVFCDCGSPKIGIARFSESGKEPQGRRKKKPSFSLVCAHFRGSCTPQLSSSPLSGRQAVASKAPKPKQPVHSSSSVGSPPTRSPQIQATIARAPSSCLCVRSCAWHLIQLLNRPDRQYSTSVCV